MRFCTQPIDMPSRAHQLADVYAQLGSEEILMFGSDYPHAYDEGVEPLLEQLTLGQRRRVLCDNAAELYGLKQTATVAA
jgi:uncharacterized protein